MIFAIFSKIPTSQSTLNNRYKPNFRTEKDLSDLSQSVGTLINAIILNDKLRENIVPYRLVQKWLTPTLNSFILLSNQGCFPIINSKVGFNLMINSKNQFKMPILRQNLDQKWFLK